MRVGLLLADATRQLAMAGVDQPRLDARLLLAAALGEPVTALLGTRDREVTPTAAGRFAALLDRRARREPVSRLLGRREFWSLEFTLGPDTLDPRPDSETVVEAALARIADRERPLTILDLGCGTGCLLLALLKELPRARGLGVDIAPGAVAVARGNAERLDLAARSDFAVGDWASGVEGLFDIVVSNPPYIPDGEIAALAPEVAVHEPRRALAGGSDGLDFYRRIAADLPHLLDAGGIAAVEVGAGQADAVAALAGAGGLAVLERRPDLGGHERCLVLGRPGA